MRELCPGGVEFRELEDLFALKGGYTPSKADATAWSGGSVPWFRMEDIRANGRVLSDSIQHISEAAVKGGRMFAADSILVATSATIGEHALITVPHLSNQRFTSLTLKPEFADRFEIKFVFYYCFLLDEWCKSNTTTSSFSTVDMGGFRKFRFPVPPLEVQREIVRVLDHFSQLEAELEAELEARRVQYAYYRDSLLSFRGCPAQIRWIPMGEVASVRYGRDFPRAVQGKPNGRYPFFKVIDMSRPGNDPVLVEASNYVDDDDLQRLGIDLSPAGTILMPRVGAAVATNRKRLLGTSAAFDTSFLALLPGEMVDPRFLLYVLQGVDLVTLSNTGAALPSVRRTALEAVLVPVPSREEQERVVGILDGFDALVNDLSIGLPAELAARRRQYEYYRDRLLSFEEAMA